MSPSRRAVLTALGSSLATAGCLSNPPADDAATTTAQSGDGRRVPTGTTVSVDGTTVTVAAPRVRTSVVSPGMAHRRVAATAGQYVVVDVTVDGAAPGRSLELDLWSSVDGTTVDGSDPLPTVAERAYAFTFPAARLDRAGIEWTPDDDATTVTWTLPRSVLETLPRQPSFVVESVRVPRRDGRRTLALTVANEGDRDGTFRARVSFDGFSGGAVVEFRVAAGESARYAGRPGDILTYLENHGGETVTVTYPARDGLATVERSVDGAKTAEG